MPKFYKGAVTEIFFAVVLLLLLGSAVLWVMGAGSQQVTAVFNSMLANNATTQQTYNSVVQVGGYYHYFNYYIPMVVFGAALASLVLGAFLNSDPRYFSPSLIVLIILVFLSFPLSNTFMAIAQQPGIQNIAAQYNLIDYMIAYLPYIILLMTGMYLIVVALRKRE